MEFQIGGLMLGVAGCRRSPATRAGLDVQMRSLLGYEHEAAHACSRPCDAAAVFVCGVWQRERDRETRLRATAAAKGKTRKTRDRKV